MREIIYEARNLKKWFPVEKSFLRRTHEFVKAVDDVNLTVYKGETLGIVGESGCGKSTLIRLMMHLLRPTEGTLRFEGNDVTSIRGDALRRFRSQIQIIFQDPYAALNPRQRAGEVLGEALDLGNETFSSEGRSRKIKELLQMVGLPADGADKFPHEFSGGQRQRLCIARALAVNPSLIMCDECVSALDVSIQAQIINLLMRLQKDMGLTLIFVSHDLRVVRHMADHVAVMYLGKIVEYAESETLFDHPLHPYTKALLSAIPLADPDAVRKPIVLKGDIPSPIHVPSGCHFHTRCWMAREECSQIHCPLENVGDGHFTACPYYQSMMQDMHSERRN